MTIGDRISTALSSLLAASTLPGNPNVQTMVPAGPNTEERCRIVVLSDQASLRTQLLPGLYDVNGYVVIERLIGGESERIEFRAICDAVEEIIGAKFGMRTQLPAIDPKLFIYSWNLTGQSNRNNDRALIAEFTWTTFARHDPHNPTA